MNDRGGIETLLGLLDEAFRGAGIEGSDESQALLMYDEYAFGAGSLTWGTPAVEPWADGNAHRDDVMTWLERAHEQFVTHVAKLADDSELDRPRRTNWGEPRPTRWIVAAMVTHDVYHAGEINHLRSLLGPDDRWRYIQQGFG